jgi:hypothetical protein
MSDATTFVEREHKLDVDATFEAPNVQAMLDCDASPTDGARGDLLRHLGTLAVLCGDRDQTSHRGA